MQSLTERENAHSEIIDRQRKNKGRLDYKHELRSSIVNCVNPAHLVHRRPIVYYVLLHRHSSYPQCRMSKTRDLLQVLVLALR